MGANIQNFLYKGKKIPKSFLYKGNFYIKSFLYKGNIMFILLRNCQEKSECLLFQFYEIDSVYLFSL
ncbi:hypothetical protein DXA63_09255 [Segatella copri]|uniref:Uncharacterized protein n=1 Tax=Segatella copri TaxID=165179 RepID=A0AA92UP14_9BACT|nr:hypothetical protein DXA63_09255 [Segatella copri]